VGAGRGIVAAAGEMTTEGSLQVTKRQPGLS
jgi:hypothetical protein